MSYISDYERRRMREAAERKSAEIMARAAEVFAGAGDIPPCFGRILSDDGLTRYYASGDGGCWGLTAYTDGRVSVARFAGSPPDFVRELGRGFGATVADAHRAAEASL